MRGRKTQGLSLLEGAQVLQSMWGRRISSGQVMDCRSSNRTARPPQLLFTRELNRQVEWRARDPIPGNSTRDFRPGFTSVPVRALHPVLPNFARAVRSTELHRGW